MPGQTDNEKAIDALNQAIVALNEIAAESPGDQSVLIEAIADNIEAVRVELGTRSIAEVAAQNTNFADLIAALGQIDCPPLIAKFAYDISLENELSPEPAFEFQDPPQGWITPSETPGSTEYYERKCGEANLIIDGLIHILTEFDDANVATLASVSFALLSATIKGAVSAPVSGPFSIIVVVAGAVASIAGLISSVNLDFASLLTLTQNNRDDLVCLLYESNDADTAVNDIVAEFANLGASDDEQTFLNALFSLPAVANHLFLDREDNDVPPPPDPPYTTDCAACGDCQIQLYPDTLDITPGQHTWNSYDAGPKHEIKIFYCCNDVNMLDVTIHSVTGHNDYPGHNDFRIRDDCDWASGVGNLYDNATTPPPPENRYCFHYLTFWSATPFSMDVTVHGEC